jgi:hypothetical protein
MLDEASEYFQFKKCRYNNEKYKRNCARLGINRDYGLANSYTIESSVWGYEKKDKRSTRMQELDKKDKEIELEK